MRERVSALMPTLLDELETLARIPSVSADPAHADDMKLMADATVDLLRRSGAANARLLDVPNDFPAVYAEVPGPAGAPTVLLYAHYDVQPAPMSQGWDTDPWVPTRKDDGRIYGRGISDDKTGIVIHAGLLQLFDGEPPVTLRIIIEGAEESDSQLDPFLEANPELVQCDAAVIADMGNTTSGEPALTVALRGTLDCVVTVSTLDHPLHSGVFGGGAPDALTALTRMIATLHDENGDVAVDGLSSFEWTTGSLDEDEFRADADVLDGVSLVGSGALASRLWSKPAMSVIGIDAPSVAGASNVLLPSAAARISLRCAPGADLAAEFEVLKSHLLKVAPWGVKVEVKPGRFGSAFQTEGDEVARAAMAEAYGRDVDLIGSGGSVPLVNTLQGISPNAPMILWGTHDTAKSRIHGSNESVDPQEIERILLSEVLYVQKLAHGRDT